MEQHSEVFIGLDTSKLKISVAVADGERHGEVRFYGDISSEPGSVASMVKKLVPEARHSTSATKPGRRATIFIGKS